MKHLERFYFSPCNYWSRFFQRFNERSWVVFWLYFKLTWTFYKKQAGINKFKHNLKTVACQASLPIVFFHHHIKKVCLDCEQALKEQVFSYLFFLIFRMSTMTELTESRTQRLKNSLYDWKEVVLQTNSLLSWDQEWYPGVIAGVVSFFYLFVWYWDPTLITFLAFSGLFLSLADYIGPKIIHQVSKPFK